MRPLLSVRLCTCHVRCNHSQPPIWWVYSCPKKWKKKVRKWCSIEQNRTVPYSAVQYSTVQYSTVQYSTVQYSTVQYSTVQYSTIQCIWELILATLVISFNFFLWCGVPCLIVSFQLYCTASLCLKFYLVLSNLIPSYIYLSSFIQSYDILSSPILSYPFQSYSIFFNHILSHPVLPYPILSHPVSSSPCRHMCGYAAPRFQQNWHDQKVRSHLGNRRSVRPSVRHSKMLMTWHF